MNHDAAHMLEGSGRFVIERELGHGGMGVVYQALDLERDTRVALKALSHKDAVNIYRLKNEFRQLADLSHPNLVSLHELVYEGDSWFFTMELVNGTTFDTYVADGGRVSMTAENRSLTTVAGGRLVRDVSATLSQRAIGSEFPLPRAACNTRRLRLAFRQLVEALAALHNAGKLHRDIKPSNVLVTPEGRVVVLDFGLVSNQTIIDPEAQDENRTVGGCVFGTPAYMSPEQAAGETITPASDWYSAGTMLYEALTSQLPFDGSVLEILRQKEELEPLPPSEVVKGVPDDLDQLCRDLLRRDPEQRPSGPEILRYLTGHSAPPPIYDAQSATRARQHGELFVGREAHLQRLRDGFEASKGGKPVTAFVHGLSGMGKSALVRCFANELIKDDRAVVLRGRCYERETVPYKAFDNIIDALSRYMMRLPAEEAAELLPRNIHALARLFPVLRRVKAVAHARRPKYQTADARELRNQAFAALKDLLLRITDFQPLVIQIDDLQWADMDSARLLSFLMGPPDPPSLMLIGAYRRDEADNSPFLMHILGDGGLSDSGTSVIEIPVDPLDGLEAAELTGELLRDMPTANALFSAKIAREAEGVPFFINELVQHLKARTDQGRSAHSTPAGTESISLDQVLAERVASMPRDAQRLLEVLSVAAGPIEQGVALQAAGLPAGERASMLSLRAARLIRTRGTRQSDTAETYHDRVRETVVATMHPAAVRITHAKIAHAIEAWDLGDPERLVEHYTGAGDGVRAGETAVQAAHTAADKLAFNRAAELYRRAIELLPKNDAAQQGLHEYLGNALANAGRGALAAEAYLLAAERSNPANARKLQRMAARQYLRSGRVQEGTSLARRVLEQVDHRFPQSSASAIAGVLWSQARARVRGLRFDLTPEAEVKPLRLERLDALGSVFRELGVIDILRGTYLQMAYLREALDSGEPHHILQGLAWEAFNTTVAGGAKGARRAERILEIAERLADQVQTPHARATCKMAFAGVRFFSGRYAEVDALASEAIELFRDHCTGSSWEQNLLTSIRLGAIEQMGPLSEIAREAPHQDRLARELDDEFLKGFQALTGPLADLMVGDTTTARARLVEQRELLDGEFTTLNLWVMNRTADVLIYEGRGAEAHAQYELDWPEFAGSFVRRTAVFGTLAHWFRARAAIAGAMESGDPRMLKVARHCASVLRRSGRTDGRCWALIAEAGIARVSQREESADRLIRAAISECGREQMALFALYCRTHLRHSANEADRSSAREAIDELRAQGVADPVLWASVYSPGFRRD